MLLTKLHRPPVTPDILIRLDLIDLMEQNLHKPMTLVSAPAGYGKSVLTSSWLENGQHPSAWYSIGEKDDELSIFFKYLTTAIENSCPGLLPGISALVNSAKFPVVKEVAEILINELDQLEEDLILVLDDYHLIDNQEIHELINQWLRFPPEHVHLVIITRSDPPLRISNLRAHNRLTELRMNDLAFTVEQIEKLFEKLRGNLIEQRIVAHLQNSTEGWITGLRLYSLAFDAGKDPSSILGTQKQNLHSSAEFLLEEVFEHQTKEVQQLLMVSSVLERFCEELLLAVQPLSDPNPKLLPQDFIEGIIKANLFIISLDDEMKWFRYHHLFKEMLHQIATRRLLVSDTELYNRAAEWMDGNDLIEESLEYFLKAGNFSGCAEILDKRGHGVFDSLGVSQTNFWIEKIPVEVREQYPGILLQQCWLAHGALQLEKIPPLLEKLETLLSNKTKKDFQTAEVDFFQGHQLYWTGELESSIQILKRALSHTEELSIDVLGNIELALNMARQRTGEKEILIEEIGKQVMIGGTSESRKAYIYASLIFVQMLCGKASDAEVSARLMQSHAQNSANQYLINWSYYLRASANLQLCNLVAAKNYYNIAYPHRHNLDFRAVLDVLAGLALVQQLNGYPEESTRITKELIDFASKLDDPLALEIANSAKYRIALLQENQEDLSMGFKWASNFNLPPTFEGVFFWVEVQWITQVKLLLHDGGAKNVKKALQILQQLAVVSEASHLNYHAIEIRVLLSIAYEKEGQPEQALIELEQAVGMAELSGSLLPFIESRKPLSVILERLKEKEVVPGLFERLQNILEASEKETTFENNIAPAQVNSNPAGTKSIGLDPLTIREQETLQYLAQGLRNKEIADKMFVSLDAVKKHLYRIFQKLQVQNRLELINKAQEIGILNGDRRPQILNLRS